LYKFAKNQAVATKARAPKESQRETGQRGHTQCYSAKEVAIPLKNGCFLWIEIEDPGFGQVVARVFNQKNGLFSASFTTLP
jgi:hypothetical protein